MNNRKIYVGGLPYSLSDTGLGDLFTEYGTVCTSRVITDRMTGQSRGFGFVEMETPQEAQEAIQQLNGTQLEGRSLTVNPAKPRSDSSSASYAGSGSRW